MESVRNIKNTENLWNYENHLSEKKDRVNPYSVKGSQFCKPYLEFSGACAGCGETPYIKLLTQLYGDRMYLANATGCTQAWGAAMPCVPYCKNQSGQGPAWSNSLFENNAEFAYGMYLADRYQRKQLAEKVEQLQRVSQNVKIKEIARQWLEAFDQLEESAKISKKLEDTLQEENGVGEERRLTEEILKNRRNLTRKTVWMVGGDGWAYDIGFGGLDHVFASGEDVNVLVVDTEVYSNTGGQSSKATPMGAMAEFQSAGKKTRKKDLGRMLMSYPNVYVAQCAMGADPAQLLKALKEAQEYHGPSIVICYAPCINHGLKNGMGQVQREMKKAVQSGYWILYRYHPQEKRLYLDSGEPSLPLEDFLKGEVRYAALKKAYPEQAERLFEQAAEDARKNYQYYCDLAKNRENQQENEDESL